MHSGWVESARRSAASPRAPAITGGVLALIGVTEAITRAAVTDVSAQVGLVLCLLALFTTLPLAVLRPEPAAVAVSAACVLSLALFHTLTVAGLGVQLIVLYRLGRCTGRWIAVGLAAPFVVLALAGSIGHGGRREAWILTVVLASLTPAAALAGITLRARSDAAQSSDARQAIAGTLYEHTARGERARISRELHDVVAHHISMIAVQAETARLTTAGLPPAGAERLLSIGDTARAALTEMRRLLGVLREDADVGQPDLQPQPGLRQLNELLDAAREASGVGTRLILRGAPAALDPGVELAAYRIVQEALTNARRHAPGAAVDVELHYADDGLRLRVRDNGPGPPSPPSASASAGAGHGLLGMRERAVAVGGELHTCAAPGGGFLVTASLPGKGEAAG